MDRPLNVVLAGLGYFSQFHLAAWAANPHAQLVAVCDPDVSKHAEIATTHAVFAYRDLQSTLAEHEADIIDIVAPPVAHADLIRASLKDGRTIICQKPFCTSLAEADAIIAEADAAGTTIVIHENFRFQPWHRTIKAFLEAEEMGQVWQARFALRPGDGRGPDAYLSRQPAFQSMPRLLIFETAVHFIDTFRWLLGPVEHLYCDIRRLNPVIAGEDEGLLLMQHQGGARSVFDGNRLSDQVAEDPRRTMGVMQIEGEAGLLTLTGDGEVTLRPFGKRETTALPLTQAPDLTTFGGGCVANLINHVVDAVQGRGQLENEARDYMTVMRLTEAAYRSASTGRRIDMTEGA